MTDYSGLLDELRSCGGGICPANCQFFDLSESGHNCEGVLMAVAADIIEDLQAEVAYYACQQESAWISVADMLPQKGQVVVVANGKGTWDVGQYKGYYSHTDFWYWKKNSMRHVKWWMRKEDALPPPPKGEEQ